MNLKATSALIVLGMHRLAEAVHLQSRAAQSQAVCQPSYSWMQNSKNASPCQVAASVDAVCNDGNWAIDALNSSVKYALPSGPTATLCTCSWASYNLISACAACQGFPDQAPQWSVYVLSGCSSLTTQNFFPSNITLGSEVAIPFWAQTDPTQWPSQIFDAAQAQNIALQGKADFIGGKSMATLKKRISVDAISGAVIGLLFVLLAISFYTIWRLRKAGRARIVPFTAPVSANLNSNVERKRAHQLLCASNSPNAPAPHDQLRKTVNSMHTPRNACTL